MGFNKMPSFEKLLALAAVSALLYLLTISLRFLVYHPLRNYNGPWYAKFTRLPWSYHSLIGDVHEWVARLHDEYGDVVRMAPDELSFTSGQAWIDIYGPPKNGSGNLPKDLRKRLKEVNGVANMLIAEDSAHKRMRNLISPAFSDKTLTAQEPLLTSYVDKLLLVLRERVLKSPTGVVNIVKWYNYTTFDILGDLALGQSFGGLNTKGDTEDLHPWISAVFGLLKNSLFFRVGNEHAWPLNKLIHSLAPKKGDEDRNKHFTYSVETIKNRLAQDNTNRVDFFSYFLKQNEEKEGLTTGELISNAALFIIAGSETTATFMSGITYSLLTHPHHYKALTSLLRTTFPSPSSMTNQTLSQLPYLSAIIEEGLRTYPPVPSGFSRMTTAGGNTICGRYVPENTVVTVTQWAAYTSERNFKNARSFRPERWLGGGEWSGDDRKAFQPFSFGPRNCIGQSLAYAEMRLILAKMLWAFDMELQPESKHWMTNQTSFSLWDKPSLMVKVIPREF